MLVYGGIFISEDPVDSALKMTKTELTRGTTISRAPFKIPNLDEKIGGGIPYSSNTLLVGPPMSGKSTLALQFIMNGVKSGDSAVFVSTNISSEEVKQNMLSFDFDPQPYEDNGSLKFIDCYSTMLDSESSENTASIYRIQIIDLTKILIVTNEIFNQFWKKQNPIRIVYDSISALLMYTNVQTVTRFLHVYMGKLRQRQAIAFFLVEEGMHDDQTLTTLQQLANGMIKLYSQENQRFIQCVSLLQTNCPREPIPFDITSEGIICGW